MAKKKFRQAPEIPVASMADIGFLLLIFFIVSTTIDTDRGITVKLPPIPEDPSQIIKAVMHERNVLTVLINSRDQLLVENEFTSLKVLKQKAKEFIANPNHNPGLAASPDSAIVSLKNDRGTSYNAYIQVQNELKAAYNELRDEEAMKRHGKKFRELEPGQQQVIRKRYPIKISEAEPENTGGN